MYGMNGGNENIYKQRNEIEMDDVVESICCVHIYLITLKWVLFKWIKTLAKN